MLDSGRGLLQIYTGDGKGKTTAAAGLACRALGSGLRVLWVRMLKPAALPAGELSCLATHPAFTLLDAGVGVIDGSATAESVEQSVAAVFAAACDIIRAGSCDLAVFDEINPALRRGALSRQRVLQLIAERPAGVEIICTGRHADSELIALADLVTVMHAEKHPLQQGIAARKGIDY